MLNLCPWESPTHLWLYSSNVPQILYYSHFPALIVALFWGFFIFANAKKDRRLYSLLAIFGCFSLWVIFDLILWATNRPDVTIFFWSMQVLLEVLVFFFSFYLIYTFQKGKELSVGLKILIAVTLLPFILVIPTKLNLIGINLVDCTAIENIIAHYYSYLLEALAIIGIAITTIENFVNSKEKIVKKEAALLGIGIFLFLMMFIYGNLIGSFFDSWTIAQYGLFGMPVFVTFLVYTIIKFRSFSMKLLGAQALVIALWILVGAMLFLRTIENVRIVTSITLVIVVVLGIQLIRSVRREVEQREKIELLAADLERVNAKLRELDQLKSEFLSFASHQIRAPLTAIDGYASMLLQGDFGKMPERVENSIKVIDTSSKNLIKIVNEFLDVSRIEQGRMKFDFSDFDIKKEVEEVTSELEPNILAKGLTLETNAKAGASYLINGDLNKIRQVIGNLVDNSIKYTPTGGIKVYLDRKDKNILISIADTGIGIEKTDMGKLFSMFTRAKDAHKTNVSGTGLGLYLAKQIVEAHKGRIWV